MKERIRELANGQVEYRIPEFSLRPEKIEGKLNIDGLHRTEILIEVTGLSPVKGVAYSSHSRVTVLYPTFFGRRCSVNLEVNTIGLSGQAVIEGVLTLVTNAGCREIPYLFTMQEKGYGVEERIIKTIEDFAEYAKDDLQGALRLFRSRSFTQISFMRDLQRLALYQSLQADRDDQRNLEEFLACNGAKESLYFKNLSEPAQFTDIQEETEGVVLLEKNTWGYGVLHVSAKNPFISLSSDIIKAEQFEEETGRYEFHYRIVPQQLSIGVNNSEILFQTAKGDFVYQITVTQPEELNFVNTDSLRRKKADAKLMEQYLNYRISRIEEDGKEKENLAMLTAQIEALCKEETENWERKLLLIYVKLLSGRLEEADGYLDEVREEVMKNRITNIRAYCFFLYLRALFNKSEEQMDTASKLIMKYYSENEQDPVLMLLLLKTDVSYRENQSLSVLRLKELFMEGCHSPMLYLEACECYRKAPDLLRVLNDFELQTIYFGAKKGILTEDLAVSVAKVSSYENHFKPFTLRLLSFLFHKFPLKVILENICGYLIRCNCTSSEYFKWYELGVKSELTIVGLNEYYLYALPQDWKKPLPQALLLYFAYSQDLRDDTKELLYENILLYYEESSQVYREYEDQMEEYALIQLLRGRISRKLVPLYRHLVLQEMIDERLAKVLPDLLLAYEITCRNTNMRKVIIRCPELNYEDCYTLENGVCCAPIYTDDSLIIFLDQFGNRYSDVPYQKELLFAQPELLNRCEEVYPDHLMFVIRKCKGFLGKPMKDLSEQKPMERLLHCAEINDAFKIKLISRLLEYYMNQDEEAIDDSFLMNLDLSQLGYHDRRKALECMVRREHYEQVYDYISQNSVNGLRYDSLLKLAEYHMQKIKGEYEVFLLNLCLYLFGKNIYSTQTLAYLGKYYNGPDEFMKKVLLFCYEKKALLSDMPERLLGQMLFCGDYEEIEEVFTIYRNTCEVKEMVERAYNVICCYRYFVEQKPVDERVFARLETILFDEQTRDSLKAEYEELDICNIALLYYLTVNEHVTLGQNGRCELLMNRLCKKGLLFGFYAKLWQKVTFPSELNGKYLLEHRSREAKRVFITMKQVGRDEVTTLQMQKMYDGIFVSQVVLFADETLEYSISEEWEDGIHAVVEHELLANDMSFVRSGSMFETINSFSRLFAGGQEKLLEDALVQYEAKQHVVKQLFMPL